MMAATPMIWLRVRRVDGLCERCWLPSLIRFTVVILLTTGVGEHDRGIKCSHCDRSS